MPSTLSSIHRYPFKSAAGETLASAVVESLGLAGDRRWMAVDANGRFITAREHGRMWLISATLDDDALQLATGGAATIRIDPSELGERIDVTLWKDRLSVRTGARNANAWMSGFLGQPVRVVHLDQQTHRAVDPDYAQSGDEVSLADGYPLLLISQASLDGLNARLDEHVEMLRFRPSLVVTANVAHAEDDWKRIRIGAVEFDVVKSCARCVLPTVHPLTGVRDPTGQPMRTLTQYRRSANGVMFGQNLIPRGNGVIEVGDPVQVLA
ncbi:MAG: MOSC domain-containing protein [Dokdonella sp.]